MWEHYDATTLWEILPVDKNDDLELLNDRSHSHPMQSGYDSWFYSGIAGISPDEKEPGFKKIVFKPYLTKYLKQVSGSFKSPNGLILSQWNNENRRFQWKIKIPYGSVGEIWLPNSKEFNQIKINNEKMDIMKNNVNFYNLGEYKAGTYIIEAEYNN